MGSGMRWNRRALLALGLLFLGLLYSRRSQPAPPEQPPAALRHPAPAAAAATTPPPAPPPRQPPRCRVPHIVHQTWKDREVQKTFEPRITSWIHKNPEWEYRFWTDADNRALIESKFPESLAMFDGYAQNIQRADAIRYFILYGGCTLPPAPLSRSAPRPQPSQERTALQSTVGCTLTWTSRRCARCRGCWRIRRWRMWA